MLKDSDSRPTPTDRGTLIKAAVAVGVLVIFAAVLGPSVLVRPTATPGSTTSPTGVASTAVSATAAPAATAEPWADLTVEPYEPTAALTADVQDRGGIGTGTSFTLKSLTATPAVQLARGLQIDPAVAYTVVAGPSADVAHVRPIKPLVAGLRYRVRLASSDGSLAGTWAFITQAPVRVVGTLPDDKTTGVPTNTGIEVTFDQDGTSGVADHFTIEPAVAGRFEQHGRTWAFIPSKPLAGSTIYAVTVHKGVGISGSSVTLQSDRVFRFETTAVLGTASRLEFGRSMIEVRPSEHPTVSVQRPASDEGDSPIPAKLHVQIHRLPDFKSVIAAAVALAGPDSWALAAPSSTVSTTGLTKVADLDATVASSDSGSILIIPVHLAKGGYVVTIQQAGPPAQLLIQATDLSAFAMAATHDTVAWVNDLASDSAVPGATISVTGGRSLGTTGADGLLRVATPVELSTVTSVRKGVEGLTAGASHFITVTAAGLGSLLIPLGLPVPYSFQNDYVDYAATTATWWLLFATDRAYYRQTDTVHVYGTIRARSDRSVPKGLELRLRPVDGNVAAPILRMPIVASARGVFAADLKLDDLPRAAYQVDLFAGSTLVSSVWIQVSEIVKPAYQIDVQTDRHAYLWGDPVHVTATVSFYDGTAVPGLALNFTGLQSETSATTDALGQATIAAKAISSDGPEVVGNIGINVAPLHPEEGQIGGSANVRVVPSRVFVTANGAVTGGKVVVTGKLSWLDLAGLEAALARGSDVENPSGAPISGGAVRVEVIHVIEARTLIGTSYDFIEKKVVPTYEYSEKEVSLGTQTLTSAADGSFRLSLTAPITTDFYRVILSSVDPEGRKVEISVAALAPASQDRFVAPYLEVPGGCGLPSTIAHLDAPVHLTMRQADGSVAPAGHFLFVVGEAGSLETTLQDASTFVRTLRDADLPGFTARAVWLSNGDYNVADVMVDVDARDKTISIHLKPDRPSYQPGDEVTIGITSNGPTGQPIAADVIVQGVDEKLYTIGAAYDQNPLDELLAQPASGFLADYESHADPQPMAGGCGDTGGPGRDDFRDAVTFQRVTTDASGHGTVAFKLSDDLTSWHMSAVAVSSGLDAGHASVLIPVGLPFFADAVLAPEYLVGDLPILRLRGYGAGVATGDPVRFVVSAPSLGLAPTTVDGTAFQALRLPLPAMVAGDHAIRIEVTATHGGTTLHDVLIRKVHVVPSRLGTVAASYDLLGPDFRVQGGDGLTTYVITDAGRGRLIGLLGDLASSTSARFDRTVAAELARELLIKEFGVPESSLPTTGFDASRYQSDGGVGLLPYASEDLFLSARAALVAGSQVNVDGLRVAFNNELNAESPPTRERQIAATAGLAAIGDDVLVRLRAFDQTSLTVREQLWLALGFAAVGDETTARSIELAVLEASGQRLGPWVRLGVGTTLDDTLEASGLLLLLAGRLGDPIANDVSRYLIDQPSKDWVFPLEQLGYAQGMLDRLPRVAGSFAWTVDGQRHEVSLEPGGAFSLELTPTQRATLRLEKLAGDLAVATSWTATGGDLPADPAVSVERTVAPAGAAPDDQLVHVTLTVTFGPQATAGCYRLTDLLPSGLAPVVAGAGWPTDQESANVISPYDVDGQRVAWCASPSDLSHQYGYSARVVTPGTYAWEPAVIQSEGAPTLGSSTPATTFTIR